MSTVGEDLSKVLTNVLREYLERREALTGEDRRAMCMQVGRALVIEASIWVGNATDLGPQASWEMANETLEFMAGRAREAALKVEACNRERDDEARHA